MQMAFRISETEMLSSSTISFGRQHRIKPFLSGTELFTVSKINVLEHWRMKIEHKDDHTGCAGPARCPLQDPCIQTQMLAIWAEGCNCPQHMELPCRWSWLVSDLLVQESKGWAPLPKLGAMWRSSPAPHRTAWGVSCNCMAATFPSARPHGASPPFQCFSC